MNGMMDIDSDIFISLASPLVCPVEDYLTVGCVQRDTGSLADIIQHHNSSINFIQYGLLLEL